MAQSFYTPRTIQSGQVPSSQSNFTALVLLNDTRYKTTSYTGGHVANTNGYDIRFYSDAALTTALTFELVTYNASAGTGEFWVLLPTCADAVTIYIGYGDPALNTNPSSTSAWASRFKLVEHFPDGTTLSVADSSQSAISVTNHGLTAVAGKIDGAGNNAAATYADLGSPSALNLSAPFSLGSWIKTSSGSAQVLIGAYSPSTFAGYALAMGILTAGKVSFWVGNGGWYESSASINDGNWHHVKATLSGTTVTIYVDNAATTASRTPNLGYSGPLSLFTLADHSGFFFAGSGDQITIATGADIADYNTTEYNNQSNPSAFWPDGTEVQIPGPQFDAASNSGDQAASANYTFNRTVAGTNRFLIVSVELLTVTGATVTSVTDDDGGGNVALSFIGAKSTITGAGRVEMWGVVTPATGTKAIRVILSASIESVATAISYTNVHQVTPTEAFNSAQATNAGSATNASVTVTSVTDNCRIVAACVANDTSITAGQTSRNNVSGTLGSGADEDNNAAVSPAGATTMTYTGMGITTTWAIVGVAVKPYAPPTGNLFRLSSLSGIGAGGPFFQNPVN